jgi:hypothetical protein
MNTMNLIVFGDLQLGVIIFVMSWPLILRKVPMNQFYGVRIRAAFESEQRWYDINAYGGRQLATWSLLLIATGVAGFFVSPAHFDLYACGRLIAAILAVTMPLALILRQSRRG